MNVSKEDQTKLAELAVKTIEMHLRRLRNEGIIVQVDIISTQPPRMGHYEQVVSYRIEKEKS